MQIGIFGAGAAGRFLYEEIEKNQSDIDVIGFIDNYLEGDYQGKKIFCPREFFVTWKEKVDAIFIAAGAQKTLKIMINTCLANGVDNIYMMHDIAGKCRLPLFDNRGIINTRIRKLKFSKDRPSLSYYEVPVTDSCNLNCKGCLFASNMTQGLQHVNLERLEKDAKRMSEIFYDIPWIRILGGEPLMHPNIIEIFQIYRRFFLDSEIDLCTNGLLIPKMKKEFWDCVKENRVSIHISGYKPVYQLLDRLDAILKEQGIPYVILKREEFFKYYTDKADNDMQLSYQKCIASGCHEVYKGRLSKCSAVIAFEKFNDMFKSNYQIIEDEDWFNIHDPQINAWRVKEKLEMSTNVCRYCSDSRCESFEWDYSPKMPSIEEYIISRN